MYIHFIKSGGLYAKPGNSIRPNKYTLFPVILMTLLVQLFKARILNLYYKYNNSKVLNCSIEIADKLLDIVFELIDKLPDKIPTQWFAVIDSTNIQKKSYKEREYISPDILPPILPRGTLCCRTTKTKKPRTIISKKHLKTYIKSAVVQQRVNYKFFFV